jgi:hypothetical protein
MGGRRMKIYIIKNSPYGSVNLIHSAYLSKERAQAVSDELREKAYQEEILDVMYNEQMTKKEATEWVN